MRVLIAEHDHPVYAQLLRQAAPDIEVLTSGDSAELSRLATDCPVWLGQPDLLATLLRQGHRPSWLQSTWAGITPLLAEGLTRNYRLTQKLGVHRVVVFGNQNAHESNLSKTVQTTADRVSLHPGGHRQ